MIPPVQYRRIPLIIYFIILLARLLNFKSSTGLYSSHLPSMAKYQNSCTGKLEPAPFGPGSAKLSLCNLGNYAYAVYTKTGTPGYGVWMEIDSGSADTWILTSNCKSSSCALRKRFDTENSSRSLRKIDRKFNLTYGHGVRVEGELISDRICLAEGTCWNDRIVGAAIAISQRGMYADGVLGLGFQELSRFKVKARTSPTLPSLISELNPNLEPILGLKLKRDTFERGDTEYGGELTVGYVNRSTPRSTGLLLPLLPDNAGYWMVELHWDSGASSSKAIFDTGSTCILSPSQNLRATLDRWLRRGVVRSLGQHVIADCRNLTSLPNLHFTFGGNQRVQLTPQQYTLPFDPLDPCKRRVCLQYEPALHFTVLGSVFLTNFHSIFDYANRTVELIPETAGDTGKPVDRQRVNVSSKPDVLAESTVIRPTFDELLTGLATVTLIVMLAPFR